VSYINSGMGRLVRAVLDPVMLEQIQPRGKNLLDIGCGEGYFTRVLKASGAARVVGRDISPELIKKALEQDPGGEYQVRDISADHPGAPDSFDAVSACMVLMDLPDLDSAYRGISASLVPSGKFVACMINPYYSYPVGEWRKTLRSGLHRQLEAKCGMLRRIVRQLKEVVTGDYERILSIGNYFDNRVSTKMLGETATLHFHKPFSDYLNVARKYDLVLERLIEPQISPELYAQNASQLLAQALVTVPLFVVLVFSKSETSRDELQEDERVANAASNVPFVVDPQ